MIKLSDYKYLSITVEYVFKANFNDTYYLETNYFDIDNLRGNEPLWIDPYNGKSKIGNTEIALGDFFDEEFIIFEKKNGTIKENRKCLGMEHICCEDYNDSMLLSARIGLSREKREY